MGSGGLDRLRVKLVVSLELWQHGDILDHAGFGTTLRETVEDDQRVRGGEGAVDGRDEDRYEG